MVKNNFNDLKTKAERDSIMTEKESIDRGFKHVSTIPCVYDLLNLESTGTWYDDGRIVLNKPSIITKLDRIKFRSFSANIRADIENITSPNIIGKICGNFTFYNKPKSTFSPPSSATSDVVDGTEVGILPTISDMSVQIYNQAGYQQYQAANGIYQNGVNNEVTFSEFTVPLVTSFDDSINDMLRYAKYNFTKLLGLFDDSDKNRNLYDTSTFVYGEVNTKPYIQGLGGNKWINTPYSFAPNVTNKLSTSFNITYEEGVQDPQLQVGRFAYYSDALANSQYIADSDVGVPICYFRHFKSLRNDVNKEVSISVLDSENHSVPSTVNKPWTDVELTYMKHPLKYYRIERVQVNCQNNNFTLLCSTLQNNEYYSILNFSNYRRPSPYERKEELKDMLSFNMIYNPDYSTYSTMFNVVFCESMTGGQTIWFDRMYAKNEDNEELQGMIDGGYFMISAYFYSENPMITENDKKMHLVIVFTNNEDIKVLHFKMYDSETGPYPVDLGSSVLPAVTDIFTVPLPQGKRFAFIDDIWDNSNYLQHLRELQSAAVPNAPIFILPKFTDGSNSALIFKLEDTRALWCDLFGNVDANKYDNVFYNNSTIHCIRRYEVDNETKTLISACGPCCSLNDKTTFYVNMTYNDLVMIRNHVYLLWGQNFNRKESALFRDISKYVTAHNLKFPIVNAFGMYTYPWDSINENNYDLQLVNDSIAWLIDATGAQAYIKDQTFENIYSFAQSAFMINFNLKESLDAQPQPVQLYPASPTIAEPSAMSPNSYSWLNTKHITETLANPYFYAAESSFAFLENAFKVDNDGSITFPCIPVVSSDGKHNGLFTFFVKFETDPAIITFDPNVKQSERFANRYNYCKQFLNKTPSLYNDKYPFDNYLYYNNRELFDKIRVYLNLQNTDLTLKLVVSGYPSINSILFYLNEESLVDFKEMSTSPFTNTIECTLVDSKGETLTPRLAAETYKNITISADWTFFS